MKRPVILFIPLLALLVAATPVLATNGMYLAGYGAEANGRGGANIAVADRSLGMQANPAGVCQLIGNHFSVDFQLLMPELDYASSTFGSDIAGKDQTFVMPSFSYVRGGSDSKWSWGIAMASQGGMGADYNGYNTPFGTVDKTFSEVRFGRVIPTVGYAVSPNLSFGFSANIGWSDVEYKFWPGTSFYNDAGTPMDPSDDIGFFGMDMTEAAETFNYSARLGMMWRVNSKWQVGAVYESETDSDYDDGKLALNQTALGLGMVNYDVAVDGFTWPEQYGVGAQFRPTEDWMLALDAKRYNWNSAVNVIRVQATNPDNPMTPVTQQEIPFVFDWDDQWIYALGAERRIGDSHTLRFGYNYGESPVPDSTMNPLFPATLESHATVGLGWNVKGYIVNFALERAFENTQTNNNIDQNVNPFAPGSTVDHAQWTLSFGFTKAFSRK